MTGLKSDLPLRPLGLVRSFAVISDVHVRAPSDNRTRALVEWLDAASRERTEALFLLGDIFDFIYARSRFQRRHWSAVFRACARARARGLRVYFVEGNHDFGFSGGLPNDLLDCFDEAGDVVFALNHPVWGETWLRHGDDIVCPPSYGPFRALVKAQTFQHVAGVIPGIVTHLLFSAYARLSRARDWDRVLDPAFFRACLVAFFARVKAERGVLPGALLLGHVHVNLDACFEGVRVMVGPDWFQAPSALVVNERGDAVREWLREGAKAPAYALV